MSLARIAAAAAVAIAITFGLFFFMQFLISMSEERGASVTKGPVIEFVRLKRDSELQTRKREMPKKEKPPEPPPPPDLKMAQNDAPSADSLAIAAPAIDVNPDLAGGLSLGTGSGDSESVPIVRVQAIYPMRARERGIEGWVLVEFTITATGTVRDPVVLEADPPRIFDRAALRAIKKWKYRPRVVEGVAVERVERNRLTFELDQAS